MATDINATSLERALRASHERLAGLVGGLGAEELGKQSYDTGWSIADVLSHLGSVAEIFALGLDAGATGGDPPAHESFQRIWDAWNARSPQEQAADSLAAEAALLGKVESLTPRQRADFSAPMFGDPWDLNRLLSMWIWEHALHTWDIAVALDPAAPLAPEATRALLDQAPLLAGLLGKPAPAPVTVAVTTTDPVRAFVLDTGTNTGAVSLVPDGDAVAAASLSLPAEAFIRLLACRLDDESGLTISGMTLPELKSVFPAF